MNDPSPRHRTLRQASIATAGAGLVLIVLLLFSAFMVVQEHDARQAAWHEARKNDAISLANRLIRFSLELDATVLSRTENPSLMEMNALLQDYSGIHNDLQALSAVRPDLSLDSLQQLYEEIEALRALVSQRIDLLAIRNNLDVAVRENATVYEDEATPSALVALLREAIEAENLVLLGELTRQFNQDLRNSQINASLASRFRQLAFSSRGVFAVTEDLAIANEHISRSVLQSQHQLDHLISRLQDHPDQVLASAAPGPRLSSWQSALLISLTLLLIGLLILIVKRWRQFVHSGHQMNRLESLGRISGDVAHDISNMISVTISSLNVLKESTGKSGQHDRTLDKALFAADKSVGMVDRLLTFAKRNRLAPELCCVNELIEGLYEVVCLTAGDNVEVKLELCDDDTFLLIDPDQLESALINLCINAKHAIADKGTIRICTAIKHKRVLNISVIDDGCGIPRQILPRVFEPFFSTDKVNGGQGLGLSTIYGFVKQSGGDIYIASKVGKGTRVTMTFEQ